MIRPLPILKIISNSCNTILLLFSSYVSFILHLYICLYCQNWFTLCICRHSTKCRAEGGPGPATRSTRGRLRMRRQRRRRGAVRPAAPAAIRGGRCSRLPSPRPRRTGRRPLTTRTSSWPPRQEGVTLPLGGGGGSTSSTSSAPYLRGSSQLPTRPIPFQRRPVIRPKGDK